MLHIFVIITCIILIVLYINSNIENFDLVPSKKYKLCIMAIFKNEHEYLEEWLIHHISNGITHFYLYSNDPNMQNYQYLQKYNQYITLIPWVDKINDEKIGTVQRQAYTHCIQTYNNEYQYLMMLDIDEFIISIQSGLKVIDIINNLDVSNTKAIKVQRYDFGSNGHITQPTDNIMNSYLKHEKLCSNYKTIANANYIDTNKQFYGVHDFPMLNKEGKVYNPYFTYAKLGFPNGCTKEDKNEIPLVINHYYTKSYDEYLKRCEMWKDGGINNIGYRKNCKEQFKERDRNEIIGYDYI